LLRKTRTRPGISGGLRTRGA